jgi:hypothetical protein
MVIFVRVAIFSLRKSKLFLCCFCCFSSSNRSIYATKNNSNSYSTGSVATRERTRCLTRRTQQSQAIVHYPISTMGINLSPDVPTGANIGPRYSLSTLTIGNTYVGLLFYHYPISTIGIY